MSSLTSRLSPPAPRPARWFDCALIWLQFAVALAFIGRYHLLDRVFIVVGALILVGFPIHCLLPRRFRAWFFLALSLASIWLVLGLSAGSWLIAVGLILIGICHLPASLPVRLSTLAAVIVLFVLVRSGWFESNDEASNAARIATMRSRAHAMQQDEAELEPSEARALADDPGPSLPWHRGFWPSAAIWPVIGSMIMLRLIIYLYDLEHQTQPVSWALRLSYFFMLPNVCCMLFPLVDFRNFERNHYDDPDERKIYQVGSNWIFRGCVHLILYRLVYLHLVIDAHQVQTAGQLLQYLYVPFLLYLRVSGEFHLYVGILRLFGFNLPETHHLYYFSTSFTDFWRRTNIYWKDFMQKVFYFPAYFRLRKLGNIQALVLSTIFVFVVTWALHAYLWFWIRGTVLLHANDALFWTILGVLVVINSLIEVKWPPVRSLGKRVQTPRELLVKGLKALATFTTICVLWSFWSEQSIATWLSAWSVLNHLGVGDLTSLLPWIAGAVVFVLLAAWVARDVVRKMPPFHRSLGIEMACLAGLIVLAQGTVSVGIGKAVTMVSTDAGKGFSKVVRGLLQEKLNQRDYAQLQRGYYENLAAVGNHSPELAAFYRRRPAEFTPFNTDKTLVRDRSGVPWYELIPGVSVKREGYLYTINSHGMRDRERDLAPAPDRTRVTLVGASIVMGAGVNDDETMTHQLEQAVQPTSTTRWEFLNHGVQGYTLLEFPYVVEQRALPFKPAAVFYIAHHDEVTRLVTHISSAISAGREIPYDDLRQLLTEIGITPSTPPEQVTRLLTLNQDRLISWGNRRIVSVCKAAGAMPVWVYLPFPVLLETDSNKEKLMKLAKDDGFEILDLTDVYGEHDLEALRVSSWDVHPNKAGNRLIADRLLQLLNSDPRFHALRQEAQSAMAGGGGPR